ncbi:MAG: hypothetical protein IPP77_09440 [Bacteroidetes bacterium]|nr:hypothetical protein [Bacteroidota bacterium]
MTNRFTNSLPTRRENGKAGAIALSKATKFLASLGRWRFLIVPAIVFSLLLIDSSVSAQTVIQIGTGTGVPNVEPILLPPLNVFRLTG